jgi:signal transduction histidine kinase
MKIKTRLLISFLVLALVPLVAVGVAFVALARNNAKDEVLRQLESISSIQKKRLEDALAQASERLMLVESRTSIQQGLTDFYSTGNPAALDSATASLNDALGAISDFNKISVVGLDGTVLASTDQSIVGSNVSGKEYFKKGVEGNDIGIFFTGPEDTLMQYLVGPIVVDGKKLGVLAIESQATSITDLIAEYTGLGSTGETVIAEKTPEGNALFLGPTRFGEKRPLSTIVPGSKSNVAITIALKDRVETLSNAVDYRGKPVLAATQYVANPELGIVVKQDQSEAFSQANQLTGLLVIVVVIVGLLVVLASFLLARSITRPVVALTEVAKAVRAGDMQRRSGIDRDDEIGTLANAFDTMTDELVAEREGLERKVEERTEELERSNLELSGYAHTVSHDLRGPLSSIDMGANMLHETLKELAPGAPVEEMSEIVETIIYSTNRSFDLINNLLQLAKAGQEPTEVEPVDIREVVDRVVLEQMPQIEPKGMRVVADEDLGAIVATPTHMYQLFANLIGNAVKYDDNPEPVVEVHRLGDAEGGGSRYEVKDNGPGIPEKDFEKVFEPFFKSRGGGTGVGLAIVFKIIEIYGGSISACNEEAGTGACFEFVLRDYKPKDTPEDDLS